MVLAVASANWSAVGGLGSWWWQKGCCRYTMLVAFFLMRCPFPPITTVGNQVCAAGVLQYSPLSINIQECVYFHFFVLIDIIQKLLQMNEYGTVVPFIIWAATCCLNPPLAWLKHESFTSNRLNSAQIIGNSTF